MAEKKYAKEIENNRVSVYFGTDEAFAKSMGYRLLEVEVGWDGNWYKKGFVPAEPEAHKKQVKHEELVRQLNELDQRAARSMRAVCAGTATQEDKDFLAQLEAQAGEVRKQLQQLGGNNDYM